MFVVKITVFLPMSWDCPCHGKAAVFTPDKQTAFKAAVAEVAGVSTEDVALAEIAVNSPAKRRLLTEGIRVEVHVQAGSKFAAEEIAQRLTAWKLNRELAKVGLPAASVIEPANVHQVSSTREPNFCVQRGLWCRGRHRRRHDSAPFVSWTMWMLLQTTETACHGARPETLGQRRYSIITRPRWKQGRTPQLTLTLNLTWYSKTSQE